MVTRVVVEGIEFTCFVDLAELFADLGELRGGHEDDGAVLGVGYAKLLRVERHKVQLELGSPVALLEQIV